MAEPFIGEVRLFGFDFPPVGWAICDGSLLPIAGNEPLFTLIGTTYGGDGQTTFGLPDLRGRLPIHQGQRPGGVPRVIGEHAGTEQVQLTSTTLPPHTHGVGTSAAATTTRPGVPARGGSYAASGSEVPSTTGTAGGSAPIGVLDPYLVGNFCIAVEGLFPSQT